MRPYFSQVEDLLVKYEIGVYVLDHSAALMRVQGWQRPQGGYWTKEGQPFKIVIDIFPIFQALSVCRSLA